MATNAVDLQACLRSAEHALSTILLDDANNRGEAKSWLISTISHLQPRSISSNTRLTCFHPCSIPIATATAAISNRQHQTQIQQPQGSLSSCKPAVLQLLLLLSDAQPSAVAHLLCKDPDFLRSYLTSSHNIITTWFGHFSLSGIQHFKYGARALANYALTHRTDVWQYLVWAGKHDQAPVAVAVKPHYFAELDVVKTIKQLARYCPEFWSSEELLRSCEAGDWLKLDSVLISEELFHLLHEPRSSRHQPLKDLVSSFIAAADWTLLCNRLLPLLSEQQLMSFIHLLVAEQQQQQQQQHSSGVRRGGGSSGNTNQQQQVQRVNRLKQWLHQQQSYVAAAGAARPQTKDHPAEAAAPAAPAATLPCVHDLTPLVLCPAVQQWQLQQLLLANALTCHRQQLLLLLRQECTADAESGQQLLQLAAAAQQIFSKHKSSALASVLDPHLHKSGSESAPNSNSSNTAQLHFDVLLLGWLLRLHLLLAAAAGFEQAQQALHLLGCSCSVVQGKQQHQQQVATAGQAGPDGSSMQADSAAQQQQQQHGHALHGPDGQAGSGVQAGPEDQATPQQQSVNVQAGAQQQVLNAQAGPESQGTSQQQQQAGPEHQTRLQQQQQQQQPQAEPGHQAEQQQQQQQARPEQQAEQQQQQNQAEQQQQPQVRPEHQAEQQQQQLFRQPLRRGQAAAAALHSSAHGSGGSSSSDSDTGRAGKQRHNKKRHKLSKRQKVKVKGSKRRPSKHKRKHKLLGKRKRRGSSSSSDGSSSTDSGLDRKHRRKHKRRRKHSSSKHNKKRQQQHAFSGGGSSSSSCTSSNDWEEVDSMDLDAGGQLLHPADFPTWTSAAAAATTTVTAAVDGGSLLVQQQQLGPILDALVSLSVGGQLWQSPQWVVTLPPVCNTQAAAALAGSNAEGSSSSSSRARGGGSSSGNLCTSVTGCMVEVMDAVAWHMVWQWLMQLYKML